MPLHPGYIGLGLTVGGIIFSAGGFYFGTKIGGANNSKDHEQMKENIKHLDDVKMSAPLCAERHIRIDESLVRIEEKVDFLVKSNGGGL